MPLRHANFRRLVKSKALGNDACRVVGAMLGRGPRQPPCQFGVVGLQVQCRIRGHLEFGGLAQCAGVHPAIADKCPGQARRDLMRPVGRSQGDAECSDEPRDRGTDGDTARTRAASTAQTRPMFEQSAVSVRAECEL
jgi:hypothetical protein